MLVLSWQVTMLHVLYVAFPELILMLAAFSPFQAVHHVVTIKVHNYVIKWPYLVEISYFAYSMNDT